MSYEVYRVRRKFQWNVWVYSVPGICNCSKDFGSDTVSTRYDTSGKIETGQFDKNPCYQNTTYCKGLVATECSCGDAGYCSCSIKPWMYAGELWFVNEGDVRKEHILARRFVVYDPTLKAAEEYLKEEKYKVLVMGEPNPDVVYFPPIGEAIVAVTNGSVEAPEVSTPGEPSPVVRQALEAAGISDKGVN